MKKYTLAAAAAALALSGAAAFASGPSVVVVEPPTYVTAARPFVYNWTGGYIGVGLTYSRSTQVGTPVTLPEASGPGLGVLLGYNWQNGNLVFGGEAAAQVSRLGGFNDCGNGPAWECETRIHNFVGLRARVGVAMDNTLLFVTAGYATDRGTWVVDDGMTTTSDSTRFNGPVVGVGVEHGFTPQWSVRGDLEHYRYSTANIFGFPVTHRTNLARLSVVRRF